MVEAKEIRTVTNLSINSLTIKTTIIKVTVDNTITHVEVSIKQIITPNLEAGVTATLEVITMDVAMADLIIKAMPITSIINIMAMMKANNMSNMVRHVLYVVDIITLLNTVSGESMTLKILWRK